MSKYSEYLDTQKQIEALKAQVESLEKDKKVQTMAIFGKKLDALMAKHGMTRAQVLALWRISDTTAVTRKPRIEKKFKNPTTGEIIKTKGGNHKILKAWKAEFGAEQVAQWEI